MEGVTVYLNLTGNGEVVLPSGPTTVLRPRRSNRKTKFIKIITNDIDFGGGVVTLT